MTAPADDLESLLALRDAINTSINTYVSLTPAERATKPKVDQARQQIWRAAAKLASETVVPQQQATLIAFQVSMQNVGSGQALSSDFCLAMAECSCANGTGAGSV